MTPGWYGKECCAIRSTQEIALQKYINARKVICRRVFVIKKLINKIFSGEAGGVYRGMLILLMGSGLGRIVGLASIPILTRLYSPDDYGILAIYTSIVAILVPVMTLRYVTAIPLPKTDAMAFNLFVLCAKLIVLGTLLVGILLALYGKTILGWFSMEKLAAYWWLIAIGVMGASSYELFGMWATRQKNFKVIARTQISQSLLGNLVKIGLGLLAVKPFGLVAGQVIAQSGGIGSYLKSTSKDFKKLTPSLDNKKQKILAGYYQDFPKYRLPSQFLMVLSVQAPVIMMAALHGSAETGQLGLAIMALALPVSLVGGAISQAYYSEVAAIGKANVAKIRRITVNTQVKLLAISAPIALIFIIVAKHLFEVLFGEEWAVAGEYAAILAPYVLLQFTSSPLVQVINILGKQFFFLAINILRVAGLLSIYLCSSVFWLSAESLVMLISVFSFLFYLCVSIFIFKVMGLRNG